MNTTDPGKAIGVRAVQTRDKLLPDFENPPVDETVLSIQFSPIPGFSIPHYGLFWDKVRSEYPHIEVHPPIPSVTEQTGRNLQTMRIGLQLIGVPDVRCWYVDKSRNRLFQVQRDRFTYNWRRINGSETYPRYPSLRDSLNTEWCRFREFLKSEKLDVPQVNQCEVTYVNHIEYDKGWTGYGELHKVITAWAEQRPKGFLPSPENASLEVHYRWSDDSGRLHISLQPVIRARDGKEVLQLTLVARGAPKSLDDEAVFQCLDHSREWIVRGFAEFTTESMQTTMWGRK